MVSSFHGRVPNQSDSLSKPNGRAFHDTQLRDKASVLEFLRYLVWKQQEAS